MPQCITNQQQLLATFGLGDSPMGNKGKKKKKSSDADDDDKDDGSHDEHAEHRATAHEEERRCRQDLYIEALDTQKILNGRTKVNILQARNLYQPWTHQSKISSDATEGTFQGMRLIQFHTFELLIKLVASHSRAMHLMACMVIAEQAVINAYRPELLEDLAGEAAVIRFALEENTALYHVVFPGAKRQTTLTNTKALIPHLVNFTWLDGLAVNQHVLTKVEHSFDLGFESAAHKHDVMRSRQSNQEDTTGAVNVQEQPLLRPEVQRALENLVKFLNANAYTQCQSSKSKKQVFQNEVPSSETLAAAY
ncbi:uncharacterized protein BJ212DRAFT_1485981 [Suillus subaureus]|uniref:Uncharacterized protein n=1 Tax=Suillus subaureus TaxID=48587 RepID=A0A9P7DY28_9AGAM|nr:uncharacterized protein BJ212DRAFT_1485981 [Suillus subaureus]KAG1806220.1 hypothetical protein BJ212DRAFT_1485981 [Suillus subaureus]